MISSLEELEQAAASLARVPELAAKGAADGIRAALEEEFAAGQDPYGKAWKPLADSTLDQRSQTFEPPLTDFGDMRGSVNVYVRQDGQGVALEIAHPASPHQTGWAGRQGAGPARPILPYAALPATWELAIEEATTAAIDEVLGGLQ